jgi:predicted nucleic acid-binding protein
MSVERGLALHARPYPAGRPDTGLTATAKVRRLIVLTRNVDDFRDRGVPLLNPYKDPPEQL